MTTPGYGGYEGYGDAGDSVHDAVGAYVLGVLDDADATAFEAHLAGCGLCTARMEELAGMEPMLAMLAQSSPSVPPPPRPAASSSDPPLLNRLVDEVTVQHARRRRRARYMLAAAVALIIAGPAAAVGAMSGDDPRGNSNVASPAEDAFFNQVEEKVQATDATTRVSATVGMEKKGWGTHAVLELKNVKGPLKCSLVAVSKTGEEEVVTSWAVPAWGYGIENSPNELSRKPLYVHGGAAMPRNDIDHFEVRTFDGRRLVEITT